MRSTDELIAALVVDMRPVTPLPPWPARLTVWSLASGLWVGVWLLLWFDAPSGAVWASGVGWQHTAWLVTAGFGSAATALRRGVPGDGRTWDLLFVTPAALWIVASGSVVWPDAGTLDWTCVVVCVGAAALPWGLLAVLVSRAAPPTLTAHVLTAVGGVSLGALTAGLTCGHTGGGHHVASHLSPAALAIVAGVAVCCVSNKSYERTLRD